MKAKIGWIRFDSEYKTWEFTSIEPTYYGGMDEWVQIVYFEVEQAK